MFASSGKTVLSVQNLHELIRHLDSYTKQGVFPYNKLVAEVKSVENSSAVRRYVRILIFGKVVVV